MAAQILPSETLAMPALSRPLLEDLLTEVDPELELRDDREIDDLVGQLRMAVTHLIWGYQATITLASRAAAIATEDHPTWATSIQAHYQRAHQLAQDPRIRPALALFAANMEAAFH